MKDEMITIYQSSLPQSLRVVIGQNGNEGRFVYYVSKVQSPNHKGISLEEVLKSQNVVQEHECLQ